MRVCVAHHIVRLPRLCKNFKRLRADLYIHILSLSIFIPCIIGLMRIKVIHQSYFWFIAYLILGVSLDLSTLFTNNLFIINVFQDLFSFISIELLLLLFYKWGFLNNNKKSLLIITTITAVILFIDIILQSDKKIKIPWGYMINCSVMIVVSLSLLNSEFSLQRRPFFKNPKVLILMPLIIYYLYFIVLNLLMAFLFNSRTQELFKDLYYIINYINLLRYFLFSLALLWAPKREKYL